MRIVGRSSAFACLLSVLAAAPAVAQTIRGTVVLPDSTTPVPGAIVVAADAHGATAARVLTNARGEFVARLPAAGRYGITILRIGFRPTSVPAVDVDSGAGVTIRVIFAGTPVQLAAVDVRDRQTCRVSADTGLAVARVWDEARKAMLSSQLSAGGAPLVAQWIVYDRVLDSAARYVRRQTIRTTDSPTTHAFRSAPVSLLDTAGYVVSDGTGTTYHLPDAEVLLSPMFSATHCFRLQAPPNGDATLVGVGFTPTRARADARDIEGTAWVDRATSELRSIELQYTNLPPVVQAAHPSGQVEFLRLGDGQWLINRWSIRMPQLGTTTRTSLVGGRVMSGSGAIVRATQVTGGEVNRVSRGDSTLYVWRGPHIRAQIVSDDSVMRVAGALLTIEGTDYTARADADGRVDLTPVLGGRYRALVRTALMDSLGMPPSAHDIEARADARLDTLRLPPPRALLEQVCPRDSISKGEGFLRGRALDANGQPLGQAAVLVTWQSDFEIVSDSRGNDAVSHRERTIGTLSDGAGNWRICGVPRDKPLFVSVNSAAGSASRGTRLEREFGAVDLQLGSSDQSRAETALVAAGVAGRRAAFVEIAVFNLAGVPVPDATVDVEPATGPARRVVTGATGRALIPEIPPGLLTIRARRIGFKEGQLAVTVDAGRNTIPIILGESVAPTLDTMRVIGGRTGLGRLDEFETRRLNKMATVSITRDDIRKRNPIDIYELLRGIPSIEVSDTGAVSVKSTRSKRVLPDGTTRPCFLAVMVDGLLMTAGANGEPFDLRQLPRPDEIHGVEVFAGPSSIPPQYGGLGGNGQWCGMIAVWTRSGDK